MRFIISLPAVLLWLLAYHVGERYGGIAIETIFWMSLLAAVGTVLLKMCDYITVNTCASFIPASAGICMAGIQSAFPGHLPESDLPFWWAVISGGLVLAGVMIFTFRDAHRESCEKITT